MIRELEFVPRETFDRLGKKSGGSRQLADRRLKKYMNDGVVRGVGVIDPLMLALLKNASSPKPKGMDEREVISDSQM